MTDDTKLVVQPLARTNTSFGRWQPVVGAETVDFLVHVVPEKSRHSVQDEAASILGHGISPGDTARRETGLIVGYIQSGKTMSFETVAALARDNRFHMVIIIAGSSNPLLDQSTGRVRRDLRLDDSNRRRNWIHFQNPERNDATVQTVRDVLEDWRDVSTADEYKVTVLVTVLKHHLRLGHLTELLQTVGMEGSPVLIVDDEADQASLNTQVGQGKESTTYRRLMALRDALPLHTYLQYTATPQAPLLISLVDSLSPNFVEVLRPGGDYVGGRDFFVDNQRLIRTIPRTDLPTRANPLWEPPASLLSALRIFMVGVAVGLKQDGNMGNRSMLVHPSHLTAPHQEYFSWVYDIFNEWKRILRLADGDPDKQELIEDFGTAYDDLAATVETVLPIFDDIVRTLSFAFRRTRLLEVNARAGVTPEVDWGGAYGWILVGGQAMDRGFTVEGLTVTYMPRSIGVGNADTVQQRARFFGYKRSYLGFCRVYLGEDTLCAFQRYVEHEEDIRRQLVSVRDSGGSLNDWKRAFVLDSALRPCRQSVIEFDYIRGIFSNTWVMSRMVLPTSEVIESNRRAVKDFVGSTEFVEDDGHPGRTATQIHQVARGLSLRTVLEQLLVRIRITSTHDSQQFTGLLLQLSRALEVNVGEKCTVYRMSPKTGRRRGIDGNGIVTNLFQGQAPVTPHARRGEIYPGDRAIRDEKHVSVQIHTLELTQEDVQVCNDVPVLAVWVPARLGVSWIEQTQPEQDG